jgi:hypothetical protein
VIRWAGLSATMPTNSPEDWAEIVDGGIATAEYLIMLTHKYHLPVQKHFYIYYILMHYSNPSTHLKNSLAFALLTMIVSGVSILSFTESLREKYRSIFAIAIL